jgi:hypothetical protein
VSSTVACAMMLGVLLVLNQPFLFGSWAPVLRLVANTAAGVGVYTATVYLFFRADLMELMAFMQQMIRKSR